MMQQEQSQRLELDYRLLFEATPGLFLVLTPELRIVAASDAYLRATMTTRSAILGRDVFDVFPDNPADRQATGVRNLRASLERVRTTGAVDTWPIQKYDVRRPPEQGSVFEERYWAAVNAPVFGRDGRLAYIIHRVEDVTDFVRLKEHEAESERRSREVDTRTQRLEAEVVQHAAQVSRALAEAREASRARDELLAAVSHDLRNLLGAITMGLSLLERQLRVALGDALPKAIAQVRRASQRANELVEDLLSAAAIDTGAFSVELAPQDIAEIANEAVATASPVAEAASVRLCAEIAPELPPVVCDRRRSLQVLANLLGNALKFTPQGGAVRVVASRTGRGIRIAVSDTGPGIAPEDIPHVFDRYWTGKKGRAHGLGLGLYIARGIVEAHGGKLSVESGIGRGSTFAFELAADA